MSDGPEGRRTAFEHLMGALTAHFIIQLEEAVNASGAEPESIMRSATLSLTDTTDNLRMTVTTVVTMEAVQ